MTTAFSVASDGRMAYVTTASDRPAADVYKKELARLNREYLKALALRNMLRKKLAAADARLSHAKLMVNALLEDAANAGQPQGAGELPGPGEPKEGATA
jgi:hypothetical protein